MAQPSLLEQYVAVTVIPADLLRMLRGMKTSNSHSLLSFLVANLPTAILGRRYYNERVVRLVEPMWWEISFRGGSRHEVPSFSVDSAVVALNASLKEHALPYRVGRRCYNGNPRSRTFRSVASYIIGLVDTSRPLKLESEVLSGSPAV